MTFIDWPEGVKVAFNWNGPQGPWANVIAFTKPTFDEAQQLVLANAMMTATQTAYRLLLADSVTLENVTVTDMRVQGAPLVQSTAAALDGIDDGEQVNPSLSCIVTLRTAQRGRSFRGRMYLGGFAETWLVEGLWHADVMTGVVVQANLWKAFGLTEGWTQVVASEQYNHVVLPHATLTPVIGWVARSNIPGHQRRRDRRP